MRTPIAPGDPPATSATIKLHCPPSPAPGRTTERDDGGTTPVRTESGFPRVRGYELLAVVGCGGMGIVYEARHKELNRRVAIKMLRGEALADPEFHERFRAEAEAIARLQHPNIIQVFEVGTVEVPADESHAGPFIALEFVDGGSLTQRTYTPQAPREAAKVVETLARAAHEAHRLGVVHRDLKPANVLVTRDGVPKIADFGIAKQIDVECATAERLRTRAGTVMGTPEYMAPEHLQGDTASPMIDVYALGVILYELLTARVPFQGATFADTMMLVLRQEPVPPRRFQPEVPRDLETICLKCLEKHPVKRYDSAEELADDLARWAEGRAIRARAVGTAGRAVRWAKRNPTVTVLSIAVCLVALTGLVGIVWHWDDARNNAAEARANADAAERNAAAAQTKSDEANRNADKERWERYRLSMFAASNALRVHDTNSARTALEAAPENHRDWVWHLLSAQLDRSREVLPGRGDPIGGAAFTPDGRRVLISQHGAFLRVWDVPTRTEFRPSEPLRGHRLRLSPDGSTLAISPDEREVRLHDVNPWRLRTVLRGHTAPLWLVEFSPDGTRMLTASQDRTLRTWDARTGKELDQVRLPAGCGYPMELSPGQGVIAACRNDSHDPALWDAKTGRELVRLNGCEGKIRALRFSPAGDRVVTIDEYPTNLMQVWEVSSGRLLATLTGHENLINEVKFSRDGTRFASASLDRTVRVWDLSKPLTGGEEPARWVGKGHTGWLSCVAFSPDGRRVVSASSDRTLRYWDAGTGEMIAVLQGHANWVLAADFSADGKQILSASSDTTLRVWDVAELDADYALRGHTNFVYGVSFHPDGRRVVSSAWDGTARVWDVNSRTELARLVHTGPTSDSRIVASVAYHPSGRYLATLCGDGLARLWDAETGKELHRWPVPGRVWADSRLTFSPDGNTLAAGGHDGRVRLWDVNTRAELGVLEKHLDAVRDVAVSPDGKLIASSAEFSDPVVRIWDAATRKQLRALPGHGSVVYAVAWNPAGTLLASGSHDNTVRLWNPATGEPVGEPLKQGANVLAVAFSPDGKLMAVGCADNLIRVWDVTTRQALAELSGHRDYVHALAFSPDGTRLVSGSGDKTVRVWDTLPPARRSGR